MNIVIGILISIVLTTIILQAVKNAPKNSRIFITFFMSMIMNGAIGFKMIQFVVQKKTDASDALCIYLIAISAHLATLVLREFWIFLSESDMKETYLD